MLNPFPIQFLALLAYAVFRLVVGGILLLLGYRHLCERNTMAYTLRRPFNALGVYLIAALGGIELIFGAMFVLGFYTQIAALGTMALTLYMIIWNARIPSPLVPPRIFYTLLFGASFLLFVTGAGAFAFDLPI